MPFSSNDGKTKKRPTRAKKEGEEKNDDPEQPQARPVSNDQPYDSEFLKEMMGKSLFNKPYQAEKDDKKENEELSEKFDKLAAKYKEKPPFHS